MRSLSTKLVAFAQEPHHHHRHTSLQVRDVGPVGPSGRAVYNMVITPNIAPTPEDPTETGGGSVGYNEMIRDDEW